MTDLLLSVNGCMTPSTRHPFVFDIQVVRSKSDNF